MGFRFAATHPTAQSFSDGGSCVGWVEAEAETHRYRTASQGFCFRPIAMRSREKKRIAIGEYRIRSAGDMTVVRSGGLRKSRPWRVAGSGVSRNPSLALSHDGFPLRYYPSYKVKD